MNKVIKTQLPHNSLLLERINATDFIDCYCVDSELEPRLAAKIITSFPGWARFLLLIRNFVIKPFGLSSDGPAAADKLGAFPVEIDSPQEIIAGFNDKHLNFRVSIISQDGQVFLATWVRTNNIAGKIYLNTILPFHILIARNALSRVHDASRAINT